LRGSLQLRTGQASGWVFDPKAEARSVAVRLRVDGRVIGEGIANLPRPDVARALGIAGNHGFRLPLDGPAPAGEVRLEARAGAGRPWRPVARNGRRARQYQSFEDGAGASDSRRKLEALRLALLPNRKGDKATPLAGLSVLDLGCNEGFFSGEALRQGARRVVGVDANAAVLARARARFPAAEFRLGSWWDLPEDETFDVILLLSAIHYEPEQAALLAMLARRLAPGGTLVVECGISRRAGKVWQTVVRGDGPRRFPTHALFVEDLAGPFACRCVGESVAQRGDPIPRRVYHCVPKAGTVLLVAGPGRVGKSTLANELERRGIPLVRTDRLLGAILRDPGFDGTPLAAVVRRFSAEHPVHFGRIGDAVASERPADFVAALLEALPRDVTVASIEGEILRHRGISDPLSRALRARGLRPWVIEAQRPSVLGETGSRAVARLRTAAAFAVIAAGRLWRHARGTAQGAVRRGPDTGARPR
jgi:SAM-dependent methyltransferase